jgi:hypothetical protein
MQSSDAPLDAKKKKCFNLVSIPWLIEKLNLEVNNTLFANGFHKMLKIKKNLSTWFEDFGSMKSEFRW